MGCDCVKWTAVIFFIAGAAAVAGCVLVCFDREPQIIHATYKQQICNSDTKSYKTSQRYEQCQIKFQGNSCDMNEPKIVSCDGELMECRFYTPFDSAMTGNCVSPSELKIGYHICFAEGDNLTCYNFGSYNYMGIWIGCLYALLCLVTGLAFYYHSFIPAIWLTIITGCCSSTLTLIFAVYIVLEILGASIAVLAATIFAFVCIFRGWEETRERTDAFLHAEEVDDGETKGALFLVGIIQRRMTIEENVSIRMLLIPSGVMLYTLGTFISCLILPSLVYNKEYSGGSFIIFIFVSVHAYLWFAALLMIFLFKVLCLCEICGIRICLYCSNCLLFMTLFLAVVSGVIAVPVILYNAVEWKNFTITPVYAICFTEIGCIYSVIFTSFFYCCKACGCFDRV